VWSGWCWEKVQICRLGVQEGRLGLATSATSLRSGEWVVSIKIRFIDLADKEGSWWVKVREDGHIEEKSPFLKEGDLLSFFQGLKEQLQWQAGPLCSHSILMEGHTYRESNPIAFLPTVGLTINCISSVVMRNNIKMVHFPLR